MPICIFCLANSTDLTDEHVFPASLGGNLVIKGAVCADCNNGFSGAFEQYVATRLVKIRCILRIPDRYGKFPEVAARIEVDGQELEGKMLTDRTAQLKPIVTRESKDGIPFDCLQTRDRPNEKENTS